jgi:hypothetical protein
MALSTTGTVNVTGWDNRTVVDRSYGMLGVLPQQITDEKIQIALDLLGMVLADAVNTNYPLWTLEKMLIPLNVGQRNYTLPVGTNDVNKAFLRTSFNVTPTLLSSGPSAWVYDFGANNPTIVYNWSILWLGTPVPVTFQSSPDNATWTSVYTSNSLNSNYYGAGYTQWYDMSISAAQRYWRVIPSLTLNGATITPPNTLSITSAALYNTPNDIEMYRMNKDDYYNMTNKSFEGRPLQYYVNRNVQIGQTLQGVSMDLWPVADQTTIGLNGIMVVRRQRYIQDVGSLQQQIEVPTRWFYTVLFMLADALAFCTPEADLERVKMVQARLPSMKANMWNEERDRSPIKYNVGIGVYTR